MFRPAVVHLTLPSLILWLAPAPAHAQMELLTANMLWLFPVIMLVTLACILNSGMRRFGDIVLKLNEHDALTGLWIRERLLQATREAVGVPAMPGQRSYLFLAEIDNMSALNTAHGLVAGDEIVIAIANVLPEIAECDDGGKAIVGRWSGRRFAGLFRAIDEAEAAAKMQQLQRAIDALEINAAGTPLTITVSTAMANLPGSRAEDVDTCFQTLVTELGVKQPNESGQLLEPEMPVRYKRTFVREFDSTLAH